MKERKNTTLLGRGSAHVLKRKSQEIQCHLFVTTDFSYVRILSAGKGRKVREKGSRSSCARRGSVHVLNRKSQVI